jgi:two-component system response regulator HydG
MIRSFNEFRFFKSFRIPVESGDDIQFLVEVDSDPYNDRGEYIKDAKLLDVSVAGLGFKTHKSLSIDDEITMSINYKKLRFDINGKIVRVMSDPRNADTYICGVEISESEDREKMKRFLGQMINYFQPDRLKECLRDLALAEKYADMDEGFEALSLLVSLYQDITLYSQKEGFITSLLEEASRVVNAQRAVVYLINSDKNELEAKEAVGFTDEKNKLHFDFRQGVMGQVFTTGLSLNLDKSSDQLKFLQKDYPSQINAVAAYPLYNAQDKVIGVLQLENKRSEERFTLEDEKVLKIFALIFSSFYGAYNPLSEKSLVRRFSAPQARSVIFIGRSEATTELRKTITKLKDSNAPLIITGERGVGKSLYAQILHVEGVRNDKDFELVTCQGTPEQMLEDQLFGTKETIGVLSKCQNGTVCIEEVTAMPITTQIKLLKFIHAPANDKNAQMQVRFIFTTSKDLPEAIAQNKLHPELYQFMSQYVVLIKPLRERKKDVADLLDYYLLRECKTHGLLPKVLGEEMKERLLDYPWPGNVTELRQAMSRLVMYNAKQHVITEVGQDILPIVEQSLVPSINSSIPFVNDHKIDLKDRVLMVERELVMAEIKRCKGNKSKAAMEMGISREALRKKMMSFDEVYQRLTGAKVVPLTEEQQVTTDESNVVSLNSRSKDKKSAA